MRISDWSSDVCSSDLLADEPQAADIFRPLARNAMFARWCVEKAPALVEAHVFHAHIARLGKFSDRERPALLIPYHGTDPISAADRTQWRLRWRTWRTSRQARKRQFSTAWSCRTMSAPMG